MSNLSFVLLFTLLCGVSVSVLPDDVFPVDADVEDEWYYLLDDCNEYIDEYDGGRPEAIEDDFCASTNADSTWLPDGFETSTFDDWVDFVWPDEDGLILGVLCGLYGGDDDDLDTCDENLEDL